MELWREIRRHPFRVGIVAVAYVGILLALAWLSQENGCLTDESERGCWAWLWANPFWGSFYSNLMSTAAGVALGLPVALYLSAKADAVRRQDERDAEARQRAVERVAEAVQRQAERDAEDRARETRATEERDRLRRQRRGELIRLRGLIDLLLVEVRDQQLAMKEAQPQMRAGRASGFRHDPVAWTILSPTVLPSLPELGETAIQSAYRLSEFFKIMTIVQSRIDLAVSVGFSGVVSVPNNVNPAVLILQMASDDCDRASSVADEAIPLLERLRGEIDDQTKEEAS